MIFLRQVEQPRFVAHPSLPNGASQAYHHAQPCRGGVVARLSSQDARMLTTMSGMLSCLCLGDQEACNVWFDMHEVSCRQELPRVETPPTRDAGGASHTSRLRASES
jgi:hypothetical protein